jgi:hypothetical protein
VRTTKLDEHPTVIRHRQSPAQLHPDVLDADRLRRLCLDARADDVGFVSIGRPELDDQRDEILILTPDQGVGELRLQDESRAGPQSRSLGRKLGVPSYRRADQ